MYTTQTEVLESRLNEAIDKRRPHAEPFIKAVERDGNLLNDFIIHLGENAGVDFYNQNSQVRMKLNHGINKDLSLHTNAIYQAGEKLSIPPGYLRTLSEQGQQWTGELASHILNKHSEHTPRERVLVREVGGQVRGILSDKYRRLNTGEIYGQFIQACNKKQLQLYDAYYNDLKSWLEFVYPKVLTVKGKNDVELGMAFGMRIASSDFGQSAMELRMFMLQVVCLNGMCSEVKMREVHLGSRLPDDVTMSDRTFKYDTLTQAGVVKDTVNSLMTRDSINRYANKISKASNTDVDYDKEFVQLNKAGMLKGEVENAKKILQANRREDGIIGEGSTLWKLIQSIGRVANTSEDKARQRELEEVSGNLLEKVKI